MKAVFYSIALALTLTLGLAPSASATMAPGIPPSEPAPTVCDPWIDPLNVQIQQYREGASMLLHTVDGLYATINTQRDQIADLHERIAFIKLDWRIDTRTMKRQHHRIKRQHRTIKRQRHELRELRAELAAQQS
jgi:hypothetical protein